MRQYILDEFKKKGIDEKKAGDLSGKNRQCIERFFRRKRDYNPGMYYMYELCWSTDIEIPRMKDLDSREKK